MRLISKTPCLTLALAIAGARLQAGQFSLLSEDARSSGWAGAENPARMDFRDGMTLSASHLSWLQGSGLESLSYGQPLGKGSLGLGLKHFHLDEFDSTGGAEPAISLGESLIKAAWSQELPGPKALGLRVGLALALGLRSGSLAGDGVQSQIDFGLSAEKLWNKRLSLAAAVKNLGAGAPGQAPLALRWDASYLFQPWLRAGLSQDLSQGLGEWGLGLEARALEKFYLRLGLILPQAGDRQDGCAGLGFQQGMLTWDLALRSLGPLGSATWASLTAHFTNSKPEGKADAHGRAVADADSAPEGRPQAVPQALIQPKAPDPRPQPRQEAYASKPPTPMPVSPEWQGGDFDITVDLKDTQVRLSWPAYDQSSYQVRLAMVENGSFRPVNSEPLKEAVFDQPLVMRGVLYYFQVQVVSPEGLLKAKSKVKTVSLPGVAP